MFKLLRKYNRFMLAVFGVLLMITFLIPQAINKFSRQVGTSNSAVATLGDGEKMTGADQEQARREFQIVERLRTGLPFELKRPEHWYLLVREATAAGLVGTAESVKLPEQALMNIASMTDTRDPQLIKETFAKIQGVSQLLGLYQTNDLYSDAQLKTAAQRLLSVVSLQFVPLQSERVAADVQPTQEEIAQQLAAYGDKAPGQGENGFGYKLPDRVKLEWIKISADSIRQSMRASSDFNGVAQRKHWRQYATDKAKGFPPVENGADVPEMVKNDLLEQLTRERLDKITTEAANQLRLNRRGLAEKDGYVVLPPDWAEHKLSLQQLAVDLQGKFGTELPGYESTGDRWIPVAETSKLEGIGSATTEKFGTTQLSLSQLVASAKEFSPEKMLAVPIQQDVAGPPLKSATDQSVFIFRIIGTDPAHAPRSVDEVRDQIITDLRKKVGFQRLQEQAATLEQQAEANGLLSLAVEHDTTVQASSVYLCHPFLARQALQNGQPLSVSAPPLPVVGADRAAVEAIIDHALALPTDKPIEELPEAQRVFTVPVKDKLMLMVVRLVHQTPVTREDFAQLAQNGLIQDAISRESTGGKPHSAEDSFGWDAMVKRAKFAFVNARPEEDKDTATPAKPPANSSARVN